MSFCQALESSLSDPSEALWMSSQFTSDPIYKFPSPERTLSHHTCLVLGHQYFMDAHIATETWFWDLIDLPSWLWQKVTNCATFLNDLKVRNDEEKKEVTDRFSEKRVLKEWGRFRALRSSRFMHCTQKRGREGQDAMRNPLSEIPLHLRADRFSEV